MDPDPWERQPYDTDESWEVFRVYRDQAPPRRGVLVSIRGRAQDPVKVSRWYRSHFWKERARAFDLHLDSIRVEEQEDLHRQTAHEVAAAHMGILANSRDLVAREIEKLRATIIASEGEVIRPQTLLRFAEMVIKLDRLIRGESTERIDTNGPDLSSVSSEDLERARALLTGGAS